MSENQVLRRECLRVAETLSRENRSSDQNITSSNFRARASENIRWKCGRFE
jgi:hypothetical protein